MKPPLRPLALRIRHRAEVKRWAAKNPEKLLAYKRTNYSRNKAKFCARSRINYREKPEIRLRADLKARYDMSLEEFERLLAEQNGVCAICGLPEMGKFSRLSVDHSHESGLIRGLLCNRCNMGLGMLQDSQKTLKAAIRYLERAQKEAKDGRINRSARN